MNNFDAIFQELMEDHEFACVMAPAPPEIEDAVHQWGKMFITEDELYTDPKKPDEPARQADVHVTVKWGLHDASPTVELLKIIEETQPFEIEIGPCTLFENEENDVVKFDVESDALREFNRRVSELPNSDDHEDYQPHMTVAYVTKGCCHDLIGKPLLDSALVDDIRFIVKSVIYSGPNDTKVELFLGKPNLEEALGDEPDDEGEDIDMAKDMGEVPQDRGFKNFTDDDVDTDRMFPTLYADRKELVRSELPWQKRGLQQTASGYGGKLNTGLKISFNGKLYRLYSTCYGNAGSVWFVAKGRKIHVN